MKEKLESFIESAQEFHDKKDLIYAVNGSKLKYQCPTITEDDLLIRQATQESLVNLKYCLSYLDVAVCFPDNLALNQNSVNISGTLFYNFIEKVSSADREAINVISDRKFVEFISSLLSKSSDLAGNPQQSCQEPPEVVAAAAPTPPELSTSFPNNLPADINDMSDDCLHIPCYVNDNEISSSADANQVTPTSDLNPLCEKELSGIESSSEGGLLRCQSPPDLGTPRSTTNSTAKEQPTDAETPTANAPDRNDCPEGLTFSQRRLEYRAINGCSALSGGSFLESRLS